MYVSNVALLASEPSYTRTDTNSSANGRLALVLRDDISKLHVSVAYNNGTNYLLVKKRRIATVMLIL